MAVPTAEERSFELRQVTSLRWRNFTSAMRRIVDGVRIDSDDMSLLSVSSTEWADQRLAGDVASSPTPVGALSTTR